jgi:hypothetical protein
VEIFAWRISGDKPPSLVGYLPVNGIAGLSVGPQLESEFAFAECNDPF